MGLLAAIDNAKRVVGRNVSDLYNDPSAYAEKIVGHLRNQNAGVTPSINDEQLDLRPKTMEERVSDATESVDPGHGLGGGMLGTFIGPNSPLWDANRAAAAEMRLAGREAPESVWKALRTGRLPEGPMTQEISDAGTKVDLAKLNAYPAGTYHTAPDVVKGPVMGVHPDFQNYLIQMNPHMQDARGLHWASKQLIELNPNMIPDSDTAASVILHELGGHGAQARMGFHGGGQAKYERIGFEHLDPDQEAIINMLKQHSPETPTKSYPYDIIRELLTADQGRGHIPPLVRGDSLNLMNSLSARQRVMNEEAFKDYRDIYGEAMARLIQGRRNLSRSQISEQYPFDPDYFKQVTGSAINELRKP